MDYDTQHWDELQHLFHLAEETPPADRERVLSAACPDPVLSHRARELLAAFESDVPLPKPAPATALPPIGPYSLLSHLGTGGMGAVYLAERHVGSTLQRSALKILAPHAVGPSFLERFRREQQILGSLEHPNITRMLDAGVTDTGQPYLAMEYVEGLHLDRYCDRHLLDLPARLQLFQRVCEAVDYAHRNLIVHLDLKPSNILVTPAGGVKLLDFGTSKLLQADGRYTSTLIATPAYASPEQLRNEGVTTACDIYALGVVLFELLTGRRPTHSTNAWDTAQADTERPSEAVTAAAAATRNTTEHRLRTQLTGDISTVILKCLMTAPADRYASVSALSDDIDRFQQGRPILARPQTTVYQLSRFVARNRGSIGVSLLTLLVLIASLAYAWHGQRQALREAQRSVHMQSFMSRLFKTANPTAMGKPEPTVKDFLEFGSDALPQYIQDPDDLRHAQLSFALSLYWNEDYAPAKRLYAKALASAKAAGDVAGEAEALGNLASIAYFEGRNKEAREQVTRARELSQNRRVPVDIRFLIVQKYVLIESDLADTSANQLKILGDAVKEAQASHVDPADIAESLNHMGATLQNLGRLEEAEKNYSEALAIYRRDPLSACARAQTESGLGGLRRAQNRPAEAAELLRHSFETEVKCWGPTQYTLSVQAYWGDALIASGRPAEALAMLQKAEPLWRKPPVNKSLVFTDLKFLGSAYLECGNYKEAERLFHEAYDLFAKDVAPGSKRLGSLQFLWARALAGEGRYPEALPHAEAANRIMSDRPASPLARKNLDALKSLLSQLRAQPVAR